MNNYDFPLSLAHSFGRGVFSQADDPRCALWQANLLFTSTAVVNSLFENTRHSYIVAVMRDGIAIATFVSKLRGKDRAFTPYITYVDWDKILTVQVDSKEVQLRLTDGRHEFAVLREDDNSFHREFRTYQNHGDIPSTITLLDEPAPPPTKDSNRSKSAGWLPLIILLTVTIGYPLFVGGGSLFLAAAPGLADIAPSAVEQAISKHPEWPFSTTIQLRTLIHGFAASPKDVTADLFGWRQNSLKSLWFIPVFWVETFVPRDKQIEMMAQLIESDVVRGANVQAQK